MSASSSSRGIQQQRVRNPALLDEIAQSMLDEMIDCICLGVAFETHRSVKNGTFEVIEPMDSDAEDCEIIQSSGAFDVFGQLISNTSGVPALKKQPECVCPNCQRNLAASRFAPHLEKCMGMGRNSSRIASRRLANNSKESGNSHAGVGDDDDAEDEDWLEPGRSGSNSRKKRDKNSPRRNRTHKPHAKWKTNEEESHVDMDSFNEGDTAALRESLAQLSSSPAESTNSTGSLPSNYRSISSNSYRRDKNRRLPSSKKAAGSKDGSRGSSPPLIFE